MCVISLRHHWMKCFFRDHLLERQTAGLGYIDRDFTLGDWTLRTRDWKFFQIVLNIFVTLLPTRKNCNLVYNWFTNYIDRFDGSIYLEYYIKTTSFYADISCFISSHLFVHNFLILYLLIFITLKWKKIITFINDLCRIQMIKFELPYIEISYKLFILSI